MLGGVAPLGRTNLTQANPVGAVAPAPVAPTAEDRPTPPIAPALTASAVALAPAAMDALIEAQAQMSADASLFARQHTARKIDQLINRLDGDPPPPPAEGATFTVVRLQVAREVLV